MAIVLTSIDRTKVPTDGGYPLKLFGTFEPGTQHRVHIGILGNATDALAYAGQGKGTTVLPFTTTEMRVFTPRLPLDGPVDVFVVQIATAATAKLAGVLTVVRPDYKSLTFAYRAILPPQYLMGPRSMQQIPPLS